MKRWGIIGAGIVATALAIFAVLALSSGSGSPLAEAGERMAGQSMRMKLVMSFPLPEGQMDVAGAGVSSADGTHVEMSARYTLPGVMDDVPIDMRMRGDDMWMHSKMFASIMPAGKRWVHMRDTETPSESLTPTEYSRFLANADDVEVVDDDATVDGAPTTHYKGEVNVQEIADEIGGESEKRFERMLGNRDLPVPVEAWVGRDGLPVRIKVDYRQGDKHVTISADVLEYGVPVDVNPPPAAVTIEEAEFDELPAIGG
jgi:hypothetical protein